MLLSEDRTETIFDVQERALGKTMSPAAEGGGVTSGQIVQTENAPNVTQGSTPVKPAHIVDLTEQDSDHKSQIVSHFHRFTKQSIDVH